MTHLLVSAVSHVTASIGEDGRSYCRLGVNSVHHLAGLDVPQADRVVGGSGEKVLGLPIDIQTPYGSGVTITSSIAIGSCNVIE